MKQFVKDILPPIILKIAKRIDSYKYGWKGNYVTWHEAKSNSIGYNSEEIFFKVRDSMIKVKNGEATYERDSVIFDKIEYSWPILSGLMLASAKSGGELRVLDFGGSLGSTYYQNKKFFDELSNVSWSIVEQKRFVDIGKKEFEDNRLKFYNNIDECLKNEHPNVLLLSSVLQYIERPYDLLKEMLQYDFEYVLLDRTIFCSSIKDDRITVQNIRLKNYSSIPCWVFEEMKLKSFFSLKYKLIEDFELLQERTSYKYEKGFIWRKK